MRRKTKNVINRVGRQIAYDFSEYYDKNRSMQIQPFTKPVIRFLDMLEELNQNLSATILMVTHDSFTASYCRRILFIKDGKIFNEIHRGAKSRKEFFEEIMEVVSVLGGETNDRG